MPGPGRCSPTRPAADECGASGQRHQRVSTVPEPAQGTHVVAVRTASSRSRGMGPSHSSHVSVRPASSRSSARAARASTSPAWRAAPLAAQPLLTAIVRSWLASLSTSALRRVRTQKASASASAVGDWWFTGFISPTLVPVGPGRPVAPLRNATDGPVDPDLDERNLRQKRMFCRAGGAAECDRTSA